MTQPDLTALGPLAPLAGLWRGDAGDDVAPAADRGTRTSRYREELTLTPIGRIDNHEQVLQGLRYATKAWRVGEPDPYHEEVGYWLWDASANQVLRCFVVPRGISVVAGGTALPDAKSFSLAAELGSPTYGICANRFLDEQFKTVRYALHVTIVGPDEFRYEEDTVMQMPGRAELFHHTDQQTLRRVG